MMEDNRGEKRRKTRRRRIVGKRVDARRSMVDLDEDETVERKKGRKEGSAKEGSCGTLARTLSKGRSLA